MKEIVYIVSNINKSLAFEWIASDLNQEKFRLHFILLNPKNSQLEEYLKTNNHSCQRITYRGKKDLIPAFLKIFIYLLLKRPQVVHCHLFDANLIGLSAAWAAGIKKRIYTRHHSNLNEVYYPQMVKFDKLSNFLATKIISITKNVSNYLRAKENVPQKKIRLIYHGFKLSILSNPKPAEIDGIKTKWGIPASGTVVGVISRFVHWKGIQYIIPAFKQFLEVEPNATLILAGAGGSYENEIKTMLTDLLPQGNYVEIPFEENMPALYGCFDMFIHVPIDEVSEAFGQIYIEALTAGVPGVFTLSGIAPEFIVDRHNALTVPFKDSPAIFSAMKELTLNTVLRESLIANGKNDVKKFDLSCMLNELEKVYTE